jgi:chromosome segregation protein
MISRLKNLELHGYKTFANRTSFEFPAQITAIVGPNGSGKSNVADAIRWVLGEQSFSLLRGKKTEDMIFAGSEMRSKASMALSSLTFNNEDGWLPIDFSVVTLTRRAYRDGQNEYLLNGQRVRLKEIYELLAQSGLGQRTYTIIGQGLVDAALSLKPDERRRFFEEAAGIGLYRARREESINRLDDTRRNLTRLQDIISELEPRLRSLEKQAIRAQDYERVKADLQLVLREWYGYHWHKTQKDLTHSHDVLKAQETRFEVVKNRFDEADGQLEDQRTRVQELRTELNQHHSASSQFHAQREKVSKNLAVLDERQKSYLLQQKNFQFDKIELELGQSVRLEKYQIMRGERKILEVDLNEAVGQGEAAHKELLGRQEQRMGIEKALAENRQELISVERVKVELGAKLDELENRLDRTQRSKAEFEQLILDGSKDFEAAQKQLGRALEQKDTAEHADSQAGEDLRNQQNLIIETELRLKGIRGEESGKQIQKTQLIAQIEVLEQAEKTFSGLGQGAKYILESTRQGKLSGGYTSLNAILDVPAEYETAVAAVLGEFLDAVILQDNSDSEKVLEMLQTGEKGRAVLIPNEPNVDLKALKAETGGHVIGIASDLVGFSGDNRQLVRYLLGNVVIVRDRLTARQLLPAINLSSRVVTLRGEVFWGSGVIIAGQDGRAGVISRPRQKREFGLSLQKVNSELEDISAQINQVLGEITNQESIERLLVKGLQTSGQKLGETIHFTQKASLAVEQVRQREMFQKNQLHDLEGQIILILETIAQSKAENEKVDLQIADFENTVRRASQELARLPLEEFQSQVVHWSTNSAVIERALKEMDNRVEEFLTEFDIEKRQMTTIINRLEAVEVSIKQLEEEREALLLQEKEFTGSITKLQQKIDPMEKELQGLEKNFYKTQNDQIAAQQAVTVGERYVSQSQLEVTRQREALDSLRRKIEDDFGIVAFQYTTDVLSPTPLPLEGMVERLPFVGELSKGIEENVIRQRGQLRRMGAVNLEARTEYSSVLERYDFLCGQIEDLRKADADLRKVISELDELMKTEFRKTFNAVAAEFRHTFTRLFGGGSARLYLVDEENPAETGVEIEARLPGRREQGLMLLSGGERSLTAVALIFSLLKVSPTPFCVLDEVDAMLDEANVGRFCDLLKELSEVTQFIIITHNRNTVQTSDVIYGITMGRDSVSQVISLRLDEINEENLK